MSGAGFILAINLFVAGLLATSFMMVAVYGRTGIAARWLALGYALGMAYFANEFIIPKLADARFGVLVSVAVLVLSMAAFTVGVARKYDVPVPWRLLGAVFVASIAVNYFIFELPRHSLARMALYQAPYALMQVICAGLIMRARSRSGLDKVLLALFGLSALQFMSKPFLAYAYGGWGASPQDYIGSNYALFSQSMGTVFAMAVALLLLVILVRDILADATMKSETDTLSGLLNRRGFEEHAANAIRDAEHRGMPLSLVICDLDHFKSVNDNFGHASGDMVIATFAGFLRAAAVSGHVAGRIGGEEFAIVLPGTNSIAARLFAEGARSAFAGLPIGGLPEDRRFTASFGVAELAPGEQIGDLMRRADAALYEAKENGRDCVRVAARAGPVKSSRSQAQAGRLASI